MSLEVVLIDSQQQLDQAFKVRTVVFVEEQKVPLEEEIDEFEDSSIHFLALYDGQPCGACRWRFTEEGAKLERFAVLEDYRGKRVGSALVEACIDSIINHGEYNNQTLYLNSQIDAMPLYSKFGFVSEGPMFLECDIEHKKMVKK